MSNNTLSQEEIDQLMNQTSASENTEAAEEPEKISQTEKDVIGEVGNISMSQAATTLSELLGNLVGITTPQVKITTMEQILNESVRPKVMTTIEFKEGIAGNNMLMLGVNDSGKIADLMMDGDGDVKTDTLTELELSAVGEAMNQMIGSASTAMATMFNRVVDIHPPSVQVWDEDEQADADEKAMNAPVCEISFELEVENVLKSQIMQVFSMDAVRDITAIMLGDEATVIEKEAPAPEVEKASTPETVQEPASEKVQEKVNVQKPSLQELEQKPVDHKPRNLDLIMDVPLEFSVMLGESKKSIRDILSLGTGSVVELDKMTEEPLDIYVNGKNIAQGEVVVINENFGIRITNILSKENRLNEL